MWTTVMSRRSFAHHLPGRQPWPHRSKRPHRSKCPRSLARSPLRPASSSGRDPCKERCTTYACTYLKTKMATAHYCMGGSGGGSGSGRSGGGRTHRHEAVPSARSPQLQERPSGMRQADGRQNCRAGSEHEQQQAYEASMRRMRASANGYCKVKKAI